MKKVLILYAPVIHAGIVNLIERYDAFKVDMVLLIDMELAFSLTSVREIRALPTDQKVAWMLRPGLHYGQKLEVVSEASLAHWLPLLADQSLIAANDAVTREFIARYLPKARVDWDTTFLHWDSASVNSSAKFETDVVITATEFELKMARVAVEQAGLSPCWWRQVGAGAFREDKLLAFGYNSYRPTEGTGYAVGDVRDFVKAGTEPDKSNSIHAEQMMVAMACRGGISLEGASVFVTTAPCPTCAMLLADIRIRECFFSSGNAYLGLEEIFRGPGIKTTFVQLPAA